SVGGVPGRESAIQSVVVGAAIPLHAAVTALPRAIVVGLTVSVGDAESSSTIVRTAEPGVPTVAPPVGLLRARFTVSLGSATLLLMIGTLTVLFVVSPLAKLTVWDTAV